MVVCIRFRFLCGTEFFLKRTRIRRVESCVGTTGQENRAWRLSGTASFVKAKNLQRRRKGRGLIETKQRNVLHDLLREAFADGFVGGFAETFAVAKSEWLWEPNPQLGHGQDGRCPGRPGSACAGRGSAGRRAGRARASSPGGAGRRAGWSGGPCRRPGPGRPCAGVCPHWPPGTPRRCAPPSAHWAGGRCPAGPGGCGAGRSGGGAAGRHSARPASAGSGGRRVRGREVHQVQKQGGQVARPGAARSTTGRKLRGA